MLEASTWALHLHQPVTSSVTQYPSACLALKHEIQSTRFSAPFPSLPFFRCALSSPIPPSLLFLASFSLPAWPRPLAALPGPALLWPADVPGR